MLFSDLSLFLEKLEKTSSRLEITRILAELFKNADISEIDKITYLVLGQLAPSYRGIVFDLAEKMMLRVVARAYNLDLDKVKAENKRTGDIGETTAFLSQKSKYKNQNLKLPIKVIEVYEKLLEIAKEGGEKSQERKIEKMVGLLRGLDSLSAKFVTRIPLGKLRLGFSDKTILDSLSWMETGDKGQKALLEQAYQVLPDVGLLAKKVKELGITKACKNVSPEVGVPVLPMLAQRLKSPNEMIAKMGEVGVEPKFDGLRVLIHFDRKKNLIRAYTRNLNDVVFMFPELVKMGQFIDAQSVILDTEACGMDPKMLQMANFQTTMQRRRKYDISNKAKSVPIRFQVFDLLLKDGTNLMGEKYLERRKMLEKVIKKNNLLVIDQMILTKDPEVINCEYRKKTGEGLEGVIIKKADAAYVPGRTGWRWVKMKQEEKAQGKLSDTVDGVVMGFTVGKGKRALFGLGQFLVGVRDGEKIKTLTKVGTGLTDEEFKTFARKLRAFKVKDKPKEYEAGKNYTPDFWVTPKFVVELSGDDLTKSPTHTSGYALRFPRLVKFREDKSVKEATTVSEIKKLFQLQ